MTDDILKHIKIGMRCSAFTSPPDVCVPYLKALRVAVENLNNMQRHYKAICPNPMPLGLQSTMNLMMSQTESKIAAILGVEVKK